MLHAITVLVMFIVTIFTCSVKADAYNALAYCFQAFAHVTPNGKQPGANNFFRIHFKGSYYIIASHCITATQELKG